MTLSRRFFVSSVAAAAPVVALASIGATMRPARAEQIATTAPSLNDEGLYEHGWFSERASDLGAALDRAAAEGKHLAIYLEQRGCGACRQMHQVNLARHDIGAYVDENFVNVQVDVNGRREIVDFDGDVLSENALANRWRVVGTPTVVFIDPETAGGEPGHLAQVSRIQGYLPPFVFHTYYEWVRDGHHKTTGFRTYARAKFDELTARGIDMDAWTVGS